MSAPQLKRDPLGGATVTSRVTRGVLVYGMTHHFGSLLLLAAALSACSETSGPRSALLVLLDEVSFEPATGLHVAFGVRNVGSHTEHVPACDGRVNPVLERRRTSDWHPYAGGICLANVSMVPIPIEPGGSLTGSTGAARAEPGAYRLVVSYAPDGTAQVISQPFRVP